MPLISESQALALLAAGEVVALPTETVYGLAARVDQDEALNKIFTTKKRPFFDPLIVHVENLAQGQKWGKMDPVSQSLARRFWPGPLTLVVPKLDNLSSLINNGGPTVALRCPQHPIFLNLIRQLAVPLAAPSANMFGKTSPTQAQHVIDEFNNQVPVVDGGPCSQGIESTVVQVDPTQKKIFILRPGGIDQKNLIQFCADTNLDFTVSYKKSEVAPGHLQNHYQPTVPLVLLDASQKVDPTARELLQSLHPGPWHELFIERDAALVARHLYSRFRELSKKAQPAWISLQSHWKSDPQWAGLYDRIGKAATATLAWEKGQWTLSTKA